MVQDRGGGTVRAIAACALALLLGCSPSRRPSTAQAPTYTLAVVSGDGQSGVAVLQPVTFNVGGPSTQTVATPKSSALPLPLVVSVTDQYGRPADGVVVVFSAPAAQGPPLYGEDVIGLGTEDTDASLRTSTFSFPSTHGEAAASAQPYRIGTWTVDCAVDPRFGTSNVVTFVVTGT